MILSIEVSKYALLLSPLVVCFTLIAAIMFYQKWSFDRANEDCQECIRDLDDMKKIRDCGLVILYWKVDWA